MKKSVENLNKRKLTGGRRKSYRSRRKFEIDRYPTEPIIGKQEIVTRRVRGGNLKAAVKVAEYANVADRENKKVVKAKIIKSIDNPANRDYARRGVITRGAIIETEVGKARVVSRVGQHGVVNAVLIK